MVLGWLRWPQGWATPCQVGSTGPRDGPSGHEDGSSGPRMPTLDPSHLDLDLLLHLFVLDGSILLLQPARDMGTGWDTRIGSRPPGLAPHGCWGDPIQAQEPISPSHLFIFLGLYLTWKALRMSLSGQLSNWCGITFWKYCGCGNQP